MTKYIFKIAFLFFCRTKYGFDPFGIAAITAGAGGLFNSLFGDDDRKEYTLDDLVKYGYEPYNADKERGDLQRVLSGRRKSRRQGIKSKNFQSGKNNPTDVYTNEEDLTQAEVLGLSEIEKNKRAEDNRIASILFQLNESQPEEKGFGQNFLEGALESLPIGLEIGRLNELGKLPEDPINVTDTKKKMVDPVKDTQPIENVPISPDMINGNSDLSFLRGMTDQEFEQYLNKMLGLS